ncbi:MAG TPA: hypothetical protein VGE02_02455 [Gemmatimonadales bacterium]
MSDDAIALAPATSTRTIHVVVTCTDRKTREPAVRARSLPRGGLAARLSAWQDALAASTLDAIPAESLYAGDHWQVVRSLPKNAPAGVNVRVWVCSAGFGMVEFDTPVRPYAATFGAEHPDSVAPRGGSFVAADWWGALGEWRAPGTVCRSISEIARRSCGPRDVLLVAVSAQYLGAVHDDALAAAGVLAGRLAVLSAGVRPEALRRQGAGGESLADRLLPVDARLKTLVGGAMQSLNARLVRRAVQAADTWMDDPRRLADLLVRWAAEAPAAEVPDRVRGDDETLRIFIRDALRANPSATYTNLLRVLRRSGRACEQARFRALFETVAAEADDAVRRASDEAEA